MIQRRRLTCLSMLLAAAVAASSAHALSIDRVSTKDLAAQSELIFIGTVISVDYRNSDVEGPQHASLPHTFVTFQIERTFKGRSEAGDLVTLRFQGGPNGKGRILTVPGIPLFDVGERELLFVQGNGQALCPLVGWYQGRVRLIDGQAYSDDGREAFLDAAGALVFGAQRALPEVVTTRIGGPEFRAMFNQPRPEAAPAAGAQRLDADRLAAAVERLVGKAVNTSSKPAASARLDQKFYVSAPRPGAAPAASQN
jgi:hypothetical protein